MRLQSAIFDLDGTLLDSMPVWHDLAANTLRAQGIEPEPDLNEKIMTMTTEQAAQYCKDAYHLPETVDEIITMTEAQMEDFYGNHVQLKPGVQKFLSLLKMEGVWMYVATNTSRHLVEIALKHTGIDGFFRGIITCAEAGIGKKESAEVYERAMRRLRSNKKDTVIFEDAIHAIRTAKAAGFRVCGVYDAAAEEEQDEIRTLSDYYVRTFEELFDAQTLS